MNHSEWYGWALFALMWGCARWAHLVSRKVPDWIHADWNHQATTFIAQKDTMMTPDATNEAEALGDPAPAYSWWTPARAPHLKNQDHKLWWIPFLGPALNKDYRGLWTEIWIPILSLFMLGTVITLMDAKVIVGLDLFRVAGGIVFFAWLQSMTNVDHKTQFLPDIMTLPLMWLGLAWSVLQPGLTTPALAVQGAIVGYMSLWTLNKAFWVLRRKQGMGGGDLKLAAAIGAWVGPFGALMTIGLSSFVAIGMAILLLIARKNFLKFAYGPSLAVAGVAVYLFQPFLLYAVHNVT